MGKTGVRYRWVVLAAGTAAQASTSAYFQGLAGVGPALRAAHGLSLGGLGLLLACPTVGVLATLLVWGPVVDRYGERPTMAVGLFGAAACLLGAGLVDGLAPRAVLLGLAGAVGASVTTASGRAVLTWFPSDRRGLAMGIRQCAVPLGSGLAAACLPPAAGRFGVHGVFFALAAGCLVAGAAAVALIREPPAPPRGGAGGVGAGARATGGAAARAGSTRDVLRDRRLWRLSLAAGLLIVPQFTMIAFLVEVLHDGRGMSAARAAVVLTVAQAAGAAARILVGVWSDRAGARMRPLRALAVAAAAGMAAVAAAVGAWVPLLVAVLVVVAAVTVCWNGLAFTAAGELAPPGRAATAMSFENSANFGSAVLTPPLVGLLITGVGWSSAFLLVALAPVAAAFLLGPLVEPSGRRPGPRAGSRARGLAAGAGDLSFVAGHPGTGPSFGLRARSRAREAANHETGRACVGDPGHGRFRVRATGGDGGPRDADGAR
ncbi:MFS transporter [Frankia sp. CN6]|uniref:MFS transporter n=1 Tax=Frankia nepalensis TaxID=1836974 RepID=A0A937URU6_9ACTN|nr:MFS transporter [Frankia nepalensis]MBL7628171.1 MFS transporter [Frankia nepalensis]